MVYKFFNTIIDDVFSFLVDMPFTHRLACFRDDAVFIVFLYQVTTSEQPPLLRLHPTPLALAAPLQLYLYPVDKKRANEYGLAYEEEGDGNEEIEDSPPTNSAPEDTDRKALPALQEGEGEEEGATLTPREVEEGAMEAPASQDLCAFRGSGSLGDGAAAGGSLSSEGEGGPGPETEETHHHEGSTEAPPGERSRAEASLGASGQL